MREIKFRGKQVDENESVWRFGYLQYHNRISDGVSLWWVDPETVGQYTGAKDINGKEIYEDDIARVSAAYNTKLILQGRVYFLKDKMQYVLLDKDTFYTRLNWGQAEVIGNIHDNPELLEANQRT